MHETLPYGSWPSPITADLVVAGSVSLGGPAWEPVTTDSGVAVHSDGRDTPTVDGHPIDGWLWWSELRPQERGRVQLVRRAIGVDGKPAGEPVDVLPEGFSARTRVHEYGGGAWWLGGPAHPATVFFANWEDQRLYRFRVGDREPTAVTSEPSARNAMRYADGDVSPDGRWVICVREFHDEAWPEARNEIVALRADVHEPSDQVALVSGPDFVSNPRISPGASKLCWVQWMHPDMPWDQTHLVVADLELGADGPRCHDGVQLEPASGSWIQPRWGVDDIELWAITDAGSDRWELIVHREVDSAWIAVEQLPDDGEAGSPQWVFGQSDYCVLDGGGVVSVRTSDGCSRLARIDAPYTAVSGLAAAGGRSAMIAASFTTEPEVVLLSAPNSFTTVRPARDLGIDPEWFSVPRHIEFPTTADADGREATAYALHYPPCNPMTRGPSGSKPPLLVLSHGGPTSAARPQLQLNIQFWTSRGVAVVDVNYRGSTGYGRAYRDALRHRWGVYDTDDCIAAARFLAEQGEVDPGRLIIKGSSAGGYTTLCALTFHDEFAAGSSLYGVADLSALARDTHKFESRYLDSMVGPWPEAEAIYQERSPIMHTDRLATPVILFQGLEDEAVPPSQAEMMVDALRAKGVAFAYLPFEGEQHGFRQAANIKRVVEAELYFFVVILGFEPADTVEPVMIENR